MEQADAMAAGAGRAIRDLAFIAVVVLIAHAPLLLNDGLYWDDWLLYPQLQRGDWASIDALVREAGITPFNAAFLDLFAYLPGGVFSFRLTVFLLVLAMGWLVYSIAIEAGLSRRVALLIGLLASVFPGFQDWPLLSTAASVFDYVIFLGATLLILRAERQGAVGGAIFRGTAIVLFLLSFGFNSLLTVYFGSLVILLIAMSRSHPLRETVRRRWIYLAALFVFPFLYWWLSQRLFQPSGLYVGFNTIDATPIAVARAYREFFVNGVLDQFGQVFALIARPLVWPLLAVVIAGAVFVSYRGRRQTGTRLRQAVAGAGLGALLLGLATFPYVVVGKFPTMHGWDTRHDLLVALPLAVVLVMVAEGLAGSVRLASAGSAVLIVLCAALAMAGLQDYAALQSRWATDRAVMQRLGEMDGSGGYTVYWVHDGAPGPEDYYRFYEWSAMFGEVYGGQARVGLDTRGYDATFLSESQFFNDRYDLGGFDPNGCQANLTIKPGPEASSRTQVAVTYTFYRLFEPGRMKAYLNDLVTVDVTPRAEPGAPVCGP